MVARPRKFTDKVLLEVARRCLLEHGPSVSTTVIADEIGISQAALFKRFGTKEKLIIAALCQLPADYPMLEVLKRGPGPEPIRDQLIELGTFLVALFRQIVPCFSVMAAAGVDSQILSRPDSPPVLGREAWTSWFEIAQAQGRVRPLDASVTAVAFIGFLQARPFREHIIGDMGLTCTDGEYVTQIVDLLLTGMLPEGAK
jgi:AcrR family transcriptional regulator